jgi:hypothetical protein
MKIKTAVFWILWVGNDFTLQTVGEQSPEPASPPSFPSGLDNVDVVIPPHIGLSSDFSWNVVDGTYNKFAF